MGNWVCDLHAVNECYRTGAAGKACSIGCYLGKSLQWGKPQLLLKPVGSTRHRKANLHMGNKAFGNRLQKASIQQGSFHTKHVLGCMKQRNGCLWEETEPIREIYQHCCCLRNVEAGGQIVKSYPQHDELMAQEDRCKYRWSKQVGKNSNAGRMLTWASASCFSHRRDEDLEGCWPMEKKENVSRAACNNAGRGIIIILTYFTIALKCTVVAFLLLD